MTPALAEIVDDLSVLDDWEDRYRYLIDLGYSLEPLPEQAHTEENRVRGCASQVWLETRVEDGAGEPRLHFLGDSDAHIVRGLVALVLAIFSGQTARDILALDAQATFDRLGLIAHLTPQRSNGVRSLVQRIRDEARRALASGADPAALADSRG